MKEEITHRYDHDEDVLCISIGKKRYAHTFEVEPGFYIRHSIVEDKIVGITLIDFKFFKHSKIENILKICKIDEETSEQILEICKTVKNKKYSLLELLKDVNDENIHKEFNFGKDVGAEILER